MQHFMKAVIRVKLIVFLLVLLGCNKSEQTPIKPEKKIILLATQQFSELIKIERTFTVFEDSTYLFTENIVDINHTKIENWEGKMQILNDTLKFFPFSLGYNRSKTAVLKNGFIEFFNGEFPDRMKIERTSLVVKHLINIENFKDYSVFTFYKNSHNLSHEKDFTNLDLTTEKLAKIDVILKQTFKENRGLRNFEEYYKQIESVKNKKGENIIFIHSFCKDGHQMEYYKYYLTSMCDGGNCNVFLQINLTTGKIEVLKIGGMA